MLSGVVLLIGCNQGQQPNNTLFTLLDNKKIGINFTNQLEYNADFNIYTYRNFYNGGGVGLGDVNNDGLIDIYFTRNMQPNKLYLNRSAMKNGKMQLQFEDVTDKAGVAGRGAWSTGVAMVDINGDGWLDIYVCNSGSIADDDKQNELFINNQDGTFSEKAAIYGIADQGLSTHGVFFDYDGDGDLDLYLLNNSFRAIGSFNQKVNDRPFRDSIGGDKLYRNDGIPASEGGDGLGFKDVSEEAGIYGSVIGFGLGVTVGDVNRDGWQDIYVSNDFFERDYLYLNNGNGTFREVLTEQMRSISAASMGADMADINNDGYPEIFVTEMLPEKDKDLKQKTTFEDWNKYQENLRFDYYHQFTRNMLQLNNGDGTFSEIGRYAGVEATDWSWGALLFDMDGDGKRDIFVANGIYQDLTDQDYINFIASQETQRMIITRDGVDFKRLIDSIPVRPVPNYAFQNNGNLTFTNQAPAWGLAQLSHSNGSAYGDLDNDGDLDLVVNNVNMPAFIYLNNSEQFKDSTSHYLQFELIGEGKNTAALGTTITLKYNGEMQYVEHMPMRGFQSSMDYRPHFGLGSVNQVDTVIVDWINGKRTLLTNVPANQMLRLKQSEATLIQEKIKQQPVKTPFNLANKQLNIQFLHKENRFSDFDRERLMPHMLSTFGPKIAVGDVNGDGREDFYICGAKDSSGELFIQQTNGTFLAKNDKLFASNATSEEVDCLFFDADNDGDLDLYVACGGNEFPASSSALIDRLYINDGRGNFTLSNQVLPGINFENSSCVRAADFDKDGFIDLFVGVRAKPFLYGIPTRGYILKNDGKGNFTDVTKTVAPELLDVGMITDAIWSDFDQDGDMDLVVVGEWMPITFFKNDGGKLTKLLEEAVGLSKTNGWWNCIQTGDFNNDGIPDFVIGNHGKNSRFRATSDSPLVMLINDFDKNGSIEQIIARYEDGKLLPFARRHELVAQMPEMKKKYPRYSDYVGQSLESMFTSSQIEQSIQLKANTLASVVLISQPNGKYMLKELPLLAQFSSAYGLLVDDVDKDGNQDILMAGNFYNVKPEFGRYDADYGLLLKGDGKGNFKTIPSKHSGFRTTGEVRDLKQIKVNQQRHVLIAQSDDELLIFEY